MEPDTERMLTLEMLEGKESRGGRVALVVVELLAERDDEVGTWTWAPAMLLAARVSICAIACVGSLFEVFLVWVDVVVWLRWRAIV
jgi:hypothetical protein